MNFTCLSLSPSNYPQIEAYQLVYDTQQEACAFRIRCSWQDVFKVEVESALRLGKLVCLPFTLGVDLRLARFTAQLQFPSSANPDQVQVFCVPDDAFLLELEIGSLVGHRTKLKDLPKITAGIVEGIKKVLTESLLCPRSIQIPKLTEVLKKLAGSLDDNYQDFDDKNDDNDNDNDNNIDETSVVKNEEEYHPLLDESFALTEDSVPLLIPGQSYSSVASLVE